MRETGNVTVRIYGQDYTLRGAADADYVHKIARYVDQRMSEVASGTSGGSPARVAILAAINIADELFRQQEEGLETLISVEDQSLRLSQLLAEEMGE